MTAQLLAAWVSAFVVGGMAAGAFTIWACERVYARSAL